MKKALVFGLAAILLMGCDPTTEDRGGGREMFGGSDVDDVRDVRVGILEPNGSFSFFTSGDDSEQPDKPLD